MSDLERDALEALRGHPGGLTLGELKTALANRGVVSFPGALEALLLLSDRVVEREGRWVRRAPSRAEAVLEALDHYANETGRTLFRVDTALQELTPEQRPTVDELVAILLESGRYEMLKNNVVHKRG